MVSDSSSSSDASDEPLSFEAIVSDYYEALYRFAMSLSHDENTAADLTQQTFLVWAEKGHQLRQKSKVKSWLFTTLYREFLSIRRRHTKHPQVELEKLPEQVHAEESQAAETLDAQTVVEALQQVDEIFREPLTLFYMRQLAYKEIAEILDVPIGTIMSRLSRGKAQLRKILEAERQLESDSVENS